MKSKLQTKTVKLFTTADGREFSDKNAALAHQAVANVVAFFNGVVNEETGLLIVEAIKDDPDGFREVVGPMLRRPRSKRASVPGASESAPRRRGRPAGSKNGGEVSPT